MIHIPRVFHQVWFGGPMPDRYAGFAEGWRRYHPGWGYMLWTEANLFRLKLQRYFDAAEELCKKSDIARYEILWRFGGVYVDCDFECLKSIEPLLDGVKAFLGYEDPRSVNNAIIGAVLRHPVIADMIAEVPKRFHLPGPAFVSTGPRMVTRVVKRHPDVRLFPMDVFYPLFWTRRIHPVLTHAIHHYKTPEFEWQMNRLSRRAACLVRTSKGRLVSLPKVLSRDSSEATRQPLLGQDTIPATTVNA